MGPHPGIWKVYFSLFFSSLFSILHFLFLSFFFFSFFFFVSLLGAPLALGPLDIVHPCHPVATSLAPNRVNWLWKLQFFSASEGAHPPQTPPVSTGAEVLSVLNFSAPSFKKSWIRLCLKWSMICGYSSLFCPAKIITLCCFPLCFLLFCDMFNRLYLCMQTGNIVVICGSRSHLTSASFKNLTLHRA